MEERPRPPGSSGQHQNDRSPPPSGSGPAGPEWTSSWTSPTPPQQTRRPEPEQSRGSARERGHARVRGVARAVQLRDQENGHVLSFRIEEYDRAGNRLRPVAVELKGTGLSGQLGDGEEVAVTGKWRHGTIRARTVVNITTGAHVRVTGAKSGWLGLLVFLGLVIAVVLLFVNGVIGGGTGGPPGESPGGSSSTVSVPDLSGMSDASAIRALNEAGLHWSGDFEDSNNVPRGKVIRTDPPAGTEVERGKTVIFIVSTGPPFNR
jgi:hypothetical protein